MMRRLTNDELLNLTVDEGGTIRDYLCDLLITLVREGEDFNGERPFGSSGWQYDLYKPLIEAGVIVGSITRGGHVDDVDYQAADRLLQDLVMYVFIRSE